MRLISQVYLRSAVLAKIDLPRGRRAFRGNGRSNQNYSSLPPPIHHPPKVRAASPPNLRPTPSTQFDPDLATIPSNPWSGVHEARAAKLEPRDAVHDPRLKVRGPRTYVPGPWPSDRGPRLLSRLLSKIGRWLTGADRLRY